MREQAFRAVKGVLIAVLFFGAMATGFFMERAQAVNTSEVAATASAVSPAAVSSSAISGSAAFRWDSPLPAITVEPERIENKIKKKKPRILPTPKPTPVPTPSITSDKTDRIATYFQGSASWKSGLTWSGEWGRKKYKKKKFGAFGCGLCCMANIYSSLSPYRCSPIDMYEYARKESDYEGAGAIEWWNMSTVLSRAGFTCEMGKKPKEYEEFQKIVKKSKAMVLLVSNHNKKSMWEDTTGHYVTIFLYDKATDKVFLADSGSYERNRQWVPLKKIYQSLKTKSDRQYLAVTAYQKGNDTWRNTEFTGKCKLPSNWRTDQ